MALATKNFTTNASPLLRRATRLPIKDYIRTEVIKVKVTISN